MNTFASNTLALLKLEQAISWHQQGNLQKALEMYQQVLSVEPGNYEALHRAGMLFWQVGRVEDALGFFIKASAAQPDNFDACYNQGVALQMLGRYGDALSVFNTALLLKADSAEAHYNRGLILGALKQYQEALLSYEKAISLKPNYAEAYNNRGLILLEVFKSYAESLISFDKAISVKKDFAEAYYNRGLLLSELNRREESLSSYDKAISLKQDYCDAYNNRGIILKGFQRYEEALDSFDKAIALRPNYANAHNNRGAVLEKLGRFDDALASFDKLIALFPGFADLHYNRGLLLTRMGRFEDALVSYERAVSINPNHADANYNRALLELRLGNFGDGWPLFEWRWKTDQQKNYIRSFKQPLWLGEGDITGRTLLVHSEQGLGDFIQFIRYVPMMEARGAKVILEVPAPLESLTRSLKGSFTVIVKGEPLPDFDLHCPIMSLPLAFRTTINSIPAVTPYLEADSSRQIKWRVQLGKKVRPRVGLVWAGNASHLNDQNRSIALHILKPLLTLDVEFHSLQKEIRSDDMDVLAESSIISHQDDLHDFSDTAALIAELDLVIAVDTSVAHLAGALGKPVWILLPYVPDFRWLLERSDSPWYPTARLFRQEQMSRWDSVVYKVCSEMKAEYLSD